MGIERFKRPVRGLQGFRGPVETGSTGTAFRPYDLTVFGSSTQASYTIAAPEIGQFKSLYCTNAAASSQAGHQDLQPASTAVFFRTTAGGDSTQIRFLSSGQSVLLYGQTVTQYVVMANNGATFS